MINTELFTNRLQDILSFYNLSASAFAEKMGVGRSSISHIISGRNKPSLEFVLHILENFDEVSFDWLMYGRGNFPKNTPPSSLFEETTIPQKTELIENKEPLSKSINLFSTTDKKEIKTGPPMPTANKEILEVERIVIFYTNNTFKEYKN